MRTAVTLDSDFEVLLQQAMRERHAAFKQVPNNGLRSGPVQRSRIEPSRERTSRTGFAPANQQCQSLVDDGHLATPAIERGTTLVPSDRGMQRFA